jgi:hypothetical protein
MRKCTHFAASAGRKFVAHIRRAEAVPLVMINLSVLWGGGNFPRYEPYTRIFGVRFTMLFLHFPHPQWHILVGERLVLVLPGCVVEIGVRLVVPALAMFPDWILRKRNSFVSRGPSRIKDG